jgi:hypothetical protein
MIEVFTAEAQRTPRTAFSGSPSPRHGNGTASYPRRITKNGVSLGSPPRPATATARHFIHPSRSLGIDSVREERHACGATAVPAGQRRGVDPPFAFAQGRLRSRRTSLLGAELPPPGRRRGISQAGRQAIGACPHDNSVLGVGLQASRLAGAADRPGGLV